jgi:hypothetical protein
MKEREERREREGRIGTLYEGTFVDGADGTAAAAVEGPAADHRALAVLNTVLTEIFLGTKVEVLAVFGGDMKWIYRVLPSPEKTVLVEGFQSVRSRR